MRLTVRLFLAAVLLFGVCAAIVYVGYPELVLRALTAAARRSAGLEARTVDVAGHRVAYLEGGSGPPVVLLHGFGASKDLWNTVAAQLTPRYRVIALDLPGFGESPAVEAEGYGAETQAVRLRTFLDALGIREHHVGGNSMGGLISAIYAATYPESVRSLLIGAAPGVRSPEKSDLENYLEAGENPLLVRNEADLDALIRLSFFRPPSLPNVLKRAMLQSAIRSEATHARIFADLTEEARAGALESLLPKIEARTLIVWGAEDRLVHPSSVGVFTAAIRKSESTIFQACGHALPRECPDLLAQRYLTFLEFAP